MPLIGDTALIVGGSRGIGRAAAIELARQGADVAILFHHAADAAADVCDEIASLGRRALSVAAEIASPESIDAAFAIVRSELGLPTMFVHSAGVEAPEAYVHNQTPEEFWAYITTDLYGAYNVIHGAVRILREAGGGCIIALSSIASQMNPTRNSAGAAAKSATEALIKVVAREEARHAIRANAVAVGVTDTDMFRSTARKWGETATDQVLKAIPLGRIGRPHEVADLIAYLLDKRAAYITGKVFQIDGGQFIGG